MLKCFRCLTVAVPVCRRLLVFPGAAATTQRRAAAACLVAVRGAGAGCCAVAGLAGALPCLEGASMGAAQGAGRGGPLQPLPAVVWRWGRGEHGHAAAAVWDVDDAGECAGLQGALQPAHAEQGQKYRQTSCMCLRGEVLSRDPGLCWLSRVHVSNPLAVIEAAPMCEHSNLVVSSVPCLAASLWRALPGYRHQRGNSAGDDCMAGSTGHAEHQWPGCGPMLPAGHPAASTAGVRLGAGLQVRKHVTADCVS